MSFVWYYIRPLSYISVRFGADHLNWSDQISGLWLLEEEDQQETRHPDRDSLLCRTLQYQRQPAGGAHGSLFHLKQEHQQVRGMLDSLDLIRPGGLRSTRVLVWWFDTPEL